MIAHDKENMTIATPSLLIECDKGSYAAEKSIHASKPTTSPTSSWEDKDEESACRNYNDKSTTKVNATSTRDASKVRTTNDALCYEENTGRWTQEENLQFLIGLKIVGAGKWNKLAKYCPKRCVLHFFMMCGCE